MKIRIERDPELPLDLQCFRDGIGGEVLIMQSEMVQFCVTLAVRQEELVFPLALNVTVRTWP